MSRLAELEGQFSDIAGEISEWQGLIATAGWKRLEKIAEGQVNERARHVLHSPLMNLDGALPQEFEKGEASGIELFRTIPIVEIEQLKVKQSTIEKEIENEQSIERDVSKAGSGSSRRDGSSSSSPLLDPGSSPFGQHE
jgi:hypothetical protein